MRSLGNRNRAGSIMSRPRDARQLMHMPGMAAGGFIFLFLDLAHDRFGGQQGRDGGGILQGDALNLEFAHAACLRYAPWAFFGLFSADTTVIWSTTRCRERWRVTAPTAGYPRSPFGVEDAGPNLAIRPARLDQPPGWKPAETHSTG
jgi:hypothetical protein